MRQLTHILSKKFVFALITLIFCLGALLFILPYAKDLPLYSFIAAIVSSQVTMTLIGISYLTGQAKIDVSAVGQFGAGIVGKKNDGSSE